jgi:hypothetical protein
MRNGLSCSRTRNFRVVPTGDSARLDAPGVFITVGCPARQTGAVLVMSMVILVILTLLAISAMNTSLFQTKMAGNAQDLNRAFTAAESGLSNAANLGNAIDLNLQVKKSYDYDVGTHADVTSDWLSNTPPKRGSGYSAISYDSANFNLTSVGTTTASLNTAKTELHQGLSQIINKAQ